MPDLLKLCPFPPGPGLIPPTAQNLLFPRLRPSIPLTLPNFQPYGVIKPINPESPPNYLDPFLSQRSAERNYCSVPPFVPESMKLAPISEIKKSERDCPRTSKFQQSNTEGEKIPKTPDTWETHEKTTPTPTGGIPIKACEPHLQSELPIKSPNASTENQPFSGGMFSPNTSPNTALVKSSIVTPMLNTDDPIELSDDSVDCSSTTVLDMLSSNNRKELNLLFPQMEDYMSISNDPTSCRDQKKSKKTNKFIKNSKNKISIPTDNLPQLDLLSTEKGGVGKLAGGADLIPLISTGSAYSAKTIPSTSLTATVASSFSLSKSDIYPSNAFENSLSSTNIEGNEGRLHVYISIPTDNLPQLHLLSTEKGGVGKLAGGSDLIPLISTGSAYSSKTIPSTSLTATVASSFSLSKADIYPSNAFENSLSSTNIEGNEGFSLNMELLRKKRGQSEKEKG
ncbi:unnamed protein product [Ceratitis capitata]|uniref:(Mediterranean fruit fly) hypothetical protein n=1 Tax=Ceratitis capitata TaxID=7213 RepID=A0A811UWJ8_CERCA|nr:unnamed protein product [Ceratitis capitata]